MTFARSDRPIRWILVAAATIALMLGAAPGASATPVEPTPPSYVDNPFIPENRNLGECVSALPRPGCGSEEKSDVRQLLVFGALVGGLGLIGWRVVAGIRRQRPT